METNFTSQNSSTYTGFIYDAGVVTHTFNALIGIGTVIGNSLMIIGIRQMRRTLSDSLIQQLSSLAFSDLVAGIAPLLWSFCLIHMFNTNTKLCAATNLLYGITQYATLLNLCIISYNRWRVLSSTHQRNLRLSAKIPAVLLSVSLSWTFSLVIHLPLVAGITETSVVNGCLSPELWTKPELFIYILFLYAATLTAFDIFYIRSLWILTKRRSGLIRPLDRGVIARTSARRNPSVVVQHSEIFNVQSAHSLRIQEGRRRAQTSERLQTRAFKLLLMAVLIANLCTIPYVIIVMCIANGLILYVPEQPFMYDMQILAMNSFLNPLIYGITIREVRHALKKNFECFQCRRCVNRPQNS